MPNLSITLSSSISVSDTTLSPSPTIITRSLNNPTLAATVSEYIPFFQAANTGSAVALPATTVWVVYVKNLDAATNLSVSWTTVGGGAQTFICVPGGVFFYFQPTESAGGVTALTLTSAAGTINTEVFVAK